MAASYTSALVRLAIMCREQINARRACVQVGIVTSPRYPWAAMAVLTRLAVLPAVTGPVRVEEARLPDPGPHQVVVAHFAAGVCHSNLPRMYGARPADNTLGHESTGVVVATGRDVTTVREGDRVVVTWVARFMPDGTRRRDPVVISLSGGRQIVQQGIFTWADRTLVDEQHLVPLPPDISPISSAVMGCAVITGAGAVARSITLETWRQRRCLWGQGEWACAPSPRPGSWARIPSSPSISVPRSSRWPAASGQHTSSTRVRLTPSKRSAA